MKPLFIVLLCLFPFINIIMAQDIISSDQKTESIKTFADENTSLNTIQNFKQQIIDEFNTSGFKVLEIKNGKFSNAKINDINRLLSKSTQDDNRYVNLAITVGVIVAIVLIVSLIVKK